MKFNSLAMKLYEIDKAILDLVDEETGEIKDYEAFDALQMEREQKIESAALWVKDLLAEADAIKNEMQKLDERKKSAERNAESLKRYISYALNGEKHKTPRVSITYRKSESTDVADGFVEWAQKNNRDDLLKYDMPKASITAIKEAIKSGEKVPFALLVKKNNIIIK